MLNGNDVFLLHDGTPHQTDVVRIRVLQRSTAVRKDSTPRQTRGAIRTIHYAQDMKSPRKTIYKVSYIR